MVKLIFTLGLPLVKTLTLQNTIKEYLVTLSKAPSLDNK